MQPPIRDLKYPPFEIVAEILAPAVMLSTWGIALYFFKLVTRHDARPGAFHGPPFFGGEDDSPDLRLPQGHARSTKSRAIRTRR